MNICTLSGVKDGYSSIQHVEPKLVNSNVAAKMLDISERTLFKLRQQGKIPYIRLTTGVVRFDPADLVAALESLKVRGRRN